MKFWDDLDDGPPEYTAQILKPYDTYSGRVWEVVANTTYTVFTEFRKSRWSQDMADYFRIQMMYGTSLGNPKFRVSSS